MSIRDRLLGPCATQNLATEAVTVDVETLVANLLLFDTFVVQSFQLKEVPTMVALFGADGLGELLESGAIRFHAFRLFAGALDRHGLGLDSDGWEYKLAFDSSAPERPGLFEITNVTIGKKEEEFDRYLRIAKSIGGLTRKAQKRLISQLERALVSIPDGYGELSTRQTHLDIDRGAFALRMVISASLQRQYGIGLDPGQIKLEVRRESETAIHVASNIQSLLDLSSGTVHQLIGNALLALDRLNVRIELMKLCDAVTGVRGDELTFIDDKLGFIAAEIDPGLQQKRLTRILSITGLPSIGHSLASGRLNGHKFIDVRSSNECREFRLWLRSIDDATDREVKAQVESLRNRIGNHAASGSGKVIRFAATNGISLLPFVGPIATLALGALDTFVLDKVFPESGPTAFIDGAYSSIFEN